MSKSISIDITDPNVLSEYVPEWRWSLAGEVYSQNLSCPNDKLIKRVVRYLKQQKSGQKITVALKDIKTAENVYVDEKPTSLRWQLEALIVSGMSNAEIYGYLGLPEEFVELYENLFYNVRPFLQWQGLILSRACRQMNSKTEWDSLWKMIGFLSSPEALISYWRCDDDSKAKQILDSVLASKLQQDAIQSSHLRELSSYNATEVIGQYLDMQLRSKMIDKMPAGQPPILPFGATDESAGPVEKADVDGLIGRLQKPEGLKDKSSDETR